MAQTTTDTAASTVSGAGAASSFSGGTGTEAEFGSLGALSPTWWEPEDGSEPEPWLTPDQAFERFFEWTSDRGIELWDHQEEALMDLAAGDHVILGTPTGSGKSLVALGMLFMGMAQGKRCYYTAPIKALVSEKFFDLVQVLSRDNVGMITGDTHINTKAPVICCTAEILANDALREGEDADVGCVAMDEFHYFADPDRGWAWQVPLLTLPHTQFMLMSATLGESVGIEGIFGAFLSGLILNRYIPHVSPLMNRIEFIGNALFIPYFLIGVGMLININLLFQGSHILWVVFCIAFFGTLGKAIAAYIACLGFRLPLSSGHMMFGLTSAHAAGSIAMVMVGMHLLVAPGTYLVNDDMLNGVVMMILITCIISSILTDRSSQKIILRDKELPDAEDDKKVSDEKILVPVKYPEYADNLMSLAFLVRNQKLNRGLICLNVVYEDKDMRYNQEQGRRLLEHCSQLAAATDVMTQTQVRIAANIANGIKHAFNEFQCSEIIIGMHMHPEVSPKFWGEFHQSLFNGLSRQIIMARIRQPLNTLRRIQVAVPSRAEFEPGFYRWLERLARLAGNLDCRIQFHGREESLALINEYIKNRHPEVRADYTQMIHWNELPQLASQISPDHLFVVVTARKGTVSYKTALEHLPEEITKYFSGTNLMIIFPDQHGDSYGDQLTFAEPQHQEEISAYESFLQWFKKKFRK